MHNSKRSWEDEAPENPSGIPLLICFLICVASPGVRCFVTDHILIVLYFMCHSSGFSTIKKVLVKHFCGGQNGRRTEWEVDRKMILP